MSAVVVAAIACLLALIPALVFRKNLRLYAPPPSDESGAEATRPAMSLLIPARNEERSIRATVEAALASEGVRLEVIVLDDHSEDATAAIVTEIAARDPHVRVVPAPPLPPGWCGKQHACAVLAGQASHSLFAFLDADVRLTPQGLARMAAFLRRSGADLVSGFPHQETGTLAEQLVIPLMHFILLGFLPIARMRRARHPAFGAGCGQLFVTRRDAYRKAGGHGAIRRSLHDGLTLPRAFRNAGLATDLFDATDVAACRMYRGARELWWGVTKNATEGLAAPATILPATAILLGGQVLPPILFLWGVAGLINPIAFGLATVGAAAAYYPRMVAVRRFRQPLMGALFHPVGVLALLAMQWYAFVRAVLARPVTWKGRDYAPP
jgi:hypothetical protein